MGSKCKRFLSVLLVAMLLLSVVPNYAKATENTETEVTESDGSGTGTNPSGNDENDSGDTEEPADSADPVCYQPGDANSDKNVHVNDAFYVLYHSTFSDEYPIPYRYP